MGNVDGFFRSWLYLWGVSKPAIGKLALAPDNASVPRDQVECPSWRPHHELDLFSVDSLTIFCTQSAPSLHPQWAVAPSESIPQVPGLRFLFSFALLWSFGQMERGFTSLQGQWNTPNRRNCYFSVFACGLLFFPTLCSFWGGSDEKLLRASWTACVGKEWNKKCHGLKPRWLNSRVEYSIYRGACPSSRCQNRDLKRERNHRCSRTS